MPRAPRTSMPLAAAAENVRSDAGHIEPSCSTPPNQQIFRPVTRSMTRKPAASPDVKEGESASASKRKSIADPFFSTQSAASRPSVTRVRTPQKVTSSAWKPLTQPAALSGDLKRASVPSTNPAAKPLTQPAALSGDLKRASVPSTNPAAKPLTQPAALSGDLKRASVPSTNPTAKRSRVALSQAAKDSAAKDSPTVPRGKKNRNEECMSQGDQLDGVVVPSPEKKLQMGKSPSDVLPKWKSTIKNQDGKLTAPLSVVKSEAESGENYGIVSAKIGAASTNDTCQSAEAVQLLAQQLQPDTKNNSDDIKEAIANGTHQANQSVVPFTIKTMVDGTSHVNRSVAPVTDKAIANGMHQVNKLVAPGIAFPRNLQNDIQRKFAKLLMTTKQASGLASATAPLVTPKLEIGKAKVPSNALSDPAYARALLVQQQEKLLQQYKLANSQQNLHIKGPALLDNDEAPPIEPLGTRCQLCKLDVAFRPQGEDSRDAAAPPVVAVLSCHHAFHSSCIEAIYGVAEPSQCIACLDSVKG
ncbi:hypothetical protein ABZP36_032368 [Zizania latifolia]